LLIVYKYYKKSDLGFNEDYERLGEKDRSGLSDGDSKRLKKKL